MYFPAAVGQSRVCLPCVAQEGHRLKHAVLGPSKARWVSAIAAAPRHSLERSVLFIDLHEKMSIARRRDPFRRWEEGYAAARGREQEEKVLFDRELFYAVQPVERLAEMIERYRDAFA